MITGVVEAKSNRYDKYSILVAGGWYSSKFEINAEKGDTVEFDSGGEGKKWCSKLKITAKGDGAASTSPTGSGASLSTKSYSRGSFPVPHLDGSRAIIRQNAVTNANAYFGNNGDDYTVGELIDMARKIEAYTTGDIEAANVKAKIDSEFNPEE